MPIMAADQQPQRSVAQQDREPVLWHAWLSWAGPATMSFSTLCTLKLPSISLVHV
jgi:hypothetical protein